jgi:translation initiation factor 2 beta subunit (eIF-2beta)/eIF-5
MQKKKKKGAKKLKLDFKRQSTLSDNTKNILDNKDTPTEAEAPKSFKNDGSSPNNPGEEVTSKSKRSSNPRFRPIVRALTYDQKDLTMTKELKKFAASKGLIKKRKRSRRGSTISNNEISD